MTIVEGILILIILLIGAIGIYDAFTRNRIRTIDNKPKEDPHLARIRQMKEWDRFDDTKR